MNTRIQYFGNELILCSGFKRTFNFKATFILALGLISHNYLSAQVGISTTSITPNSSSILELRSTTLGFLPPRMTTTERDAIGSPAAGLIIYNTTTNLLNFYNGSLWQISSAGGSVSSVSVTTANGISGSVANATTTPAITLTLGAITPSSVTVSGTITGSNLSGTNTGNVTLSGQNYLSITGQAITANAVNLSGTNVTGILAAARFGALTGDITNTAGSYVTTIANGAVTFGKMQNISAPNKLLGRYSAGAGAPQELTISTGLSLDASGNLTATGGSGTVTNVSVINANGVSGSVANAGTTPAITLTLGAITPTSVTASGTITGSNLSGTNTGDQINITGNAATVTTNANLTGEVTSVGNSTTVTNASVIGKVLTGYTSGSGVISATDNILQAIQKLNGNKATNANLTGPITSVGNTTSVASQTGTGSTFVMNTSPTLITPNLGTPTTLVGTNITGTASGLTAGNVTTNANLTGDVTSVGNATTIGSSKVTNGMLAGSIDLTTKVTNTLPVSNGGTGQSSALVQGGVMYGSSTTATGVTAVGSTGQILQSGGTGAPTWVSGQTIVTLGSDVINSHATANTIADVTGLSFSVTAGITYRFKILIIYTAAAITTGSRWSINGPASPTLLAYTSHYPNSSAGETINSNVAYDNPSSSNAVSPFTTGNICTIDGIIIPSASGTVTIRFASEVANSAITAKAGSSLIWW